MIDFLAGKNGEKICLWEFVYRCLERVCHFKLIYIELWFYSKMKTDCDEIIKSVFYDERLIIV